MANIKQNIDKQIHTFIPIKGEVCTISKPYLLDDKEIKYLHKHNYLELGYCVEGHGVFNINNQLLSFNKGSIVIIPARIFHLAQSSSGIRSIWRWIYINNRITDNFSIQNFNIIKSNIIIKNEIIRLINEYDNNYRYRELRLKCRIEIILSYITEHINTPVSNLVLKSPVIQKAIELVSNGACNGLDVEQLAYSCNMSTSGLYRLFKRELNLSPKEYIDQFRIKMSFLLLEETDKTIEFIASTVGYSSISSFNRCFKKITGSTPIEWKKISIKK